MPKLTVQMCSWRSPEVLKTCINSLIKSLSVDTNIIVTLNEAEEESIKYLMALKIPFIALPFNSGTLGVDFSLPFVLKSEYVINSNDDFLFHKGWDIDLINIIENNYPCSASCGLVEKINTNNPIVRVDDLGEFTDPNTYEKFIKNVENSKYVREKKMVSYSHPIMVRSQDYLSVGGYSDNLDFSWCPGFGLDDYYPYRLWKLHGERFKFITSNKSVVYHGMSMTNNKLEKKKHNDGWNYFKQKTGLWIPEFKQKINCFGEI
jgi:uncharacterized protein YkvS